MNGENTKISIYIAIILALILIASGGYFMLSSPGDQQSHLASKNTKSDNGWTYVHDLPDKTGIYKFEDDNGVLCYYAKDSPVSDTGSLSCLVGSK